MAETLTEQEKDLICLLADAWNAFIQLPEQHSADIPEFMWYIHGAQNMILARPALRAMESANDQD